MYYKQQQPRKANSMTQRQFMRDSALAAAGLAVGLGVASGQSTRAEEAGEVDYVGLWRMAGEVVFT